MLPLDWKGHLLQAHSYWASGLHWDQRSSRPHIYIDRNLVMNCLRLKLWRLLKQWQQTRTRDTGMTRNSAGTMRLWCTIRECQRWFSGHRKEAFKLGPATSHLPFPSHLLRRQIVLQTRTHCDTRPRDYPPAHSPSTVFPPICQSNECRGNGERSSHSGAVKLQQPKRWLG